MTHSLFVKIDGVCIDPVAGTRGLFIVEDDTGASTWEEALEVGEDLFGADILANSQIL